MMYQVVVKRSGPGLGFYFERPYPCTNDRYLVSKQLGVVKEGGNVLEALILVAEHGSALEEQYLRFKAGKLTRNVDPDVEREAIEMAPLRAEYPVGPSVSLADIPMPPTELQGIVRLMLVTAEGKKGGPDDGQD